MTLLPEDPEPNAPEIKRRIFNHEAMFRNAGRLPVSFSYRDLRDLADSSIPGISQPGKTFACLRFIQLFCMDYSGAHDRFYRIKDPRRYDRLAELKKCVFSLTAAKRAVLRQTMRVEGAQLEHRLFDFIATRLEARNPEYIWRFRLRQTYSWLHERHRTGRSFSDLSQILSIAGNELALALDNEDEDRCLEAVSVIMDSGKIYYPVGRRKYNKPTVEKLYASRSLLDVLRAHVDILGAGNHEGVTHMNSGWAKVWACLFPDRLVMMDSRVSFAIGRFFQEYSLQAELDLRLMSERVGFYQVGFPGRKVEGIAKIEKRPEVWALSSINLSHFLLNFLDFCRNNDRPILNGYPFSLRGLEAKLFMLGE
jgi:hypothetical protein